jgi:hypothetical protein
MDQLNRLDVYAILTSGKAIYLVLAHMVTTPVGTRRR